MEIIKKKKKKVKKVIDPADQEPFTIFCHTIYKFFGRNLLTNQKFKKFFNNKIYNKKYESILRKANLKIIPEEYFISTFLTVITLLILNILVSMVYLFFDPFLSFTIFYVGTFSICGIGIFLYNYPLIITKTRKSAIDAAIPYLLPYMKILTKELDLAKIVEIIDEFLIYKEIKVEFRKIKYYSEFLGYDVYSSIRKAMETCPSNQLSDFLNDLVSIANSGGDIHIYVDRKLTNLNVEIEAIEKKNIETLLIFSQIYVVVLLISPLFFTIMVAILNLISKQGSSQISTQGAGLDTVFVIVALLLILPIVYAAFMMLVYFTKPLYSRLKPINQNGK